MSAESGLRLVYMTAGSKAEALAIARRLVEDRLVACVNILEGMTAVFHWEGKAQEETETVLIAKTRAEQMDAVTRTVREVHSYDVPCIVALPMSDREGNPDFLDWIRTETRTETRTGTWTGTKT